MPMTMQETREAILAMLGAANGLEARTFGPNAHTLDEYMAPGNYAAAESVERGPEGDKFNWVAYSSYGQGNYMNSQELQAQLERVFTGNELCQDVHATIYHEDEMAHRVEYRFQTSGVESPSGPDGPDFCPTCGWQTVYLRCSAGPGAHPSEACHFLCAKCGVDTGITGPCIQGITIEMRTKLEAHLTRSPNIVLDVSPVVKKAVGEILIGYALAENNLRAMMVKVPGYNPSSYLSADIERLKEHKADIVATAFAKSAVGGQDMEKCIDAIVDAEAKTRPKRNALAHGQLVHIGLTTFSVGGENTNGNDERGSRLEIEHRGETVELTEDGIQEPLNSARELQKQVGILGRILEFLAAK